MSYLSSSSLAIQDSTITVHNGGCQIRFWLPEKQKKKANLILAGQKGEKKKD